MLDLPQISGVCATKASTASISNAARPQVSQDPAAGCGRLIRPAFADGHYRRRRVSCNPSTGAARRVSGRADPLQMRGCPVAHTRFRVAAMTLALAPAPPSPVPHRLTDGAATLIEALTLLVERFPQFTCLTVLDRHGHEAHLTLGALWTRAGHVHAALAARGFRPGDVALLVLPTGPELLAAYFGVMRAGGVPGLIATPSNRVADRRVYAARVGAIIADAGARVLICDADLAGLFADDGRALLAGAALLTPDEVGATDGPSPCAAAADGIATVQYSSGSTGTPKGILLTHRAMLNNIRDVRDGLDLTPRDVSVNWIPLYHDMGLIDAFLLPLLSGCPCVLIPTMDFMRDPALWLWAIHRYRGTLSWAPNFAYTICANRVAAAELAGLDLSSWRIAINAAEPVLASTIAAFTARFAASGFAPSAMTPAWGLAENVTIATAHPVGMPPRIETIDRPALVSEGVARPTTGDGLASVAIGRCLPRCEVQVRDDTGRVLADRRVGEVWLRTDSLFTGYHRNPSLTARALVDGWLNTGDRGYLVDGDLYFIARDKDVIVIGGEKYAPHDIETLINRVDGVREGCAVAFGVLNEERGTEDIAAVVETKIEDAAQLADLRERVRAAVTSATGLALRHVILVGPGGIEKTTSGKLARRATRDRYTDAFADA
jgi:acyl-CoA synthetase (AMP-forming)/AMP-acid ligase II